MGDISSLNAETPKLHVGVVGAGLVGTAAVLALSRMPDVEVIAFEKATSPREAGAWISLTVTGQKVLTKLIPPAEINQISYRPPERGVYVTRHWRTGEVLVLRYSPEELKEEYTQARTHREPLLKLLLKHTPEGSVRYGHRVTDVITAVDTVELKFEGAIETRRFDMVIAADGIHSGTRKKYWPDHNVQYKGAVAYRTIFPVSQLNNIKHLLHDDSSAWRKDSEVVFLSELGLGVYGVVIIKGESKEYASTLRWEHSIGAARLQRLRDHYQTWDPLISKVLDVVNDIEAYPLDSGPWLRQLTRDDRVAFVGDAAHPTAGAYGAGAAMGFGDCWALCRALEVTKKRVGAVYAEYDVPRALRIYHNIRRPFLARVEQQMVFDAKDAKYVAAAAGDEEEWIRRFRERNPPNRWLTDHDVELEVQKVIAGLHDGSSL